MSNEYEFNLERIHFSSSLLSYEDSEGLVEVYLEQSVVSDFDWIGAEPDFKVDEDRLELILDRLVEWSCSQGLKIKIWAEDELGFEYPPMGLDGHSQGPI
ncbi:MAG: hypothetical protein KAI06_11270 [Anaerolineales bacterium]|nr:hypothetical protein [Anaerolineales bacterium]